MKKLLLPIIGLLLLSGCDNAPDNYTKQEPTPIVEVVDFDEPEYTENDVFSFYTSCLLIEGIKEDDYCEEICADEFDYDSCDFVEDTISDILSTGKDIQKEKEKRFSHKVVKSESKWFKKGSPKCSSNKCTQTYYKTVYYKDGSSSKNYKTESYTQKNSTTKTTTGTSTTASKYSSNLTVTKPKEDTSKIKSTTTTTTTANTTSTTASKYSSNLTATKPKEEVVEESSFGVGEVAVGAAAVGTAAALTTKTKPKSKTVKKDTGWVKSGSPYSCGSYSPSASSKPKGKKFKQTRSCKQKEIRTITYSDGSVEKSSRVTSASQSKEAIGTKVKPKAKKKKNKK